MKKCFERKTRQKEIIWSDLDGWLNKEVDWKKKENVQEGEEDNPARRMLKKKIEEIVALNLSC